MKPAIIEATRSFLKIRRIEQRTSLYTPFISPTKNAIRMLSLLAFNDSKFFLNLAKLNRMGKLLRIILPMRQYEKEPKKPLMMFS